MYYVYVYLNLLKVGMFVYDNLVYHQEPFYVGKGIGKRRYSHLYKSVSRNKLKINTINKILKLGQKPIIEIIFQSNLEKEAYEKEIYLIKIIGRRDLKQGPLSNMTDGGEGSSRVHSQKEKDKKRITVKDKIKSGILWGFFKPEYVKTKHKPVLQYDIYENFIKKWDSIIDIEKSMRNIHRSHISEYSRGLRKTHCGFIWKYENVDHISIYQNKKLKNKKNRIDNLSRDKKIAVSLGLKIDTYFKYRIEKGNKKWKTFLKEKHLKML